MREIDDKCDTLESKISNFFSIALTVRWTFSFIVCLRILCVCGSRLLRRCLRDERRSATWSLVIQWRKYPRTWKPEKSLLVKTRSLDPETAPNADCREVFLSDVDGLERLKALINSYKINVGTSTGKTLKSICRKHKGDKGMKIIFDLTTCLSDYMRRRLNLAILKIWRSNSLNVCQWETQSQITESVKAK